MTAGLYFKFKETAEGMVDRIHDAFPDMALPPIVEAEDGGWFIPLGTKVDDILLGMRQGQVRNVKVG